MNRKAVTCPSLKPESKILLLGPQTMSAFTVILSMYRQSSTLQQINVQDSIKCL